MTVNYKEAKNVRVAVNSILGRSVDTTAAIVRVALMNVIENKLSAILSDHNKEYSRSEIESMVQQDLSTHVHAFLSQSLDEFKYAVLSNLAETEVKTRVSKKEYAEDGKLKDVVIDVV